MPQSKPMTGIALACAAAICFAANTSLSPISTAGGGTVLTYLMLRTIVALAVILAILKLSGTPLALEPRRRWAAFGMGSVMALYSLALLSAIEFIPVALAVLIFYTFPLLTTLFLWLTGRERASWTAGGALVVAFVGLLLALDLGDPALNATGVVLAALSAVGITVVVVLNSRLVGGGGDSRPVTFHMLISATLVYVVIVATAGEFALPTTASGIWAAAIGPFFYAGAVITIFMAISMRGPIRTSMTMNLEPVASMAFGFVLLGQTLDSVQLSGAALVIAAVLVVQRSKEQNPQPVSGEPS